MWKGAEDSKTKQLTLGEIKKQLIDSIVNNNMFETDKLKKKPEEVQNPKKAAEVIQECENVIRTKKKGPECVAYYEGIVFKKFKDKKKFTVLANKLKIHKTTIIFKISAFKLFEKFPKLLKSSIGLGFFKNYFKSIKEICLENEKEFP